MPGKLMTVAIVGCVAAGSLVSFGHQTPKIEPVGREDVWGKGRMPDACRPYLEWFAPNQTCRTDLCVLTVSIDKSGRVADRQRLLAAIERMTGDGLTVVRLACGGPRSNPAKRLTGADVQRAVRMVRSQAGKRGFSPDKIGALGFSVGADLVLQLATCSQMSAYPAQDAVDGFPCNLLFAVPVEPTGAAARKFDGMTCPMCLFQVSGKGDPPTVSTLVYRELRRMKIPSELHLALPEEQDRWLDRTMEFIRQMNFDGRIGPEIELKSRYDNSDARGWCARNGIWPDGQSPNRQSHQCDAFIEWNGPKVLKTKAIMIIFSGGCYMGCDPGSFEVAPARRYLNEQGMTALALRYRVPRPKDGLAKHVSAWQDLQRAIRVVRSQAKAKGLDPERIGVMGSSAGGHLALLGAVSSRRRAYEPIDDIDRLPCDVQIAVAIYPAYVLTDGIDCHNTGGGNGDEALVVPELSFDGSTCPVLFVHGDDDGWASMGSVKCWERLCGMGVRSELHTLAKRAHCFQRSASPGTGSYTYLERVWEFMTATGFSR